MQSDKNTKLPETDFRKSPVGRASGGRWQLADLRLTMDSVLSCHSPTPGNLWKTFLSLGDSIPPRNVQTGVCEGNSSASLFLQKQRTPCPQPTNSRSAQHQGGISPHSYKSEFQPKIMSDVNIRVLSGPWSVNVTSSDNSSAGPIFKLF